MNVPSLFEPDVLASKNDAAPAATRAGVLKQTSYHKYKQKNQSPPAHHAAPMGTSSVAAEMIEPHCPSRRELVFSTIKAAGTAGLTDEEGATTLGLSAQSYTPRRNELVKQGLIIDSGLRRHTTSGRPAAVWLLASLSDCERGVKA